MNYASRLRILGLPIVHIATGPSDDGRRKRGVAKGWIALGDISIGVIFSAGGVAVGGLAIGGLGLGVISISGLALGVFSFGGVAVGYWALGGLAIALNAAIGGLAVAREYAIGGEAVARNANNELAMRFFRENLFFNISQTVARHFYWLYALLLLPIFLGLYHRWKKYRDENLSRDNH